MGIGFVYEITSRCDQDCVFCYNIWKEPGASAPRELSLPDIRRVLDNALSLAGSTWLAFAGGEPLLSDNLLPAIRHVRDVHPRIRVGVASNGQNADRRTLESLREAGVFALEIALHTSDNELFARLVRHSPEHPRAAIAQASALGMAVAVSVILTTHTVRGLRKTLELALLLGASRVTLNRFVPPRLARANALESALSSDDLKRALAIANRAAEEWDLPIDVTIPVEPCLIDHGPYPNLHFSKCVCGREKWCIGPEGNLRTCEQNASALGSLLREPIAKLVSTQAVEAFRAWKRFPACSTCAAFGACASGCRFVRHKQTDSIQSGR